MKIRNKALFKYSWEIICPACGKHSEGVVVSVNPNKKTMTFDKADPNLAFSPFSGGLKSRFPLPGCGHLYNWEGVEVKPIR